jgi:hypothetical protein
VGTSKQPDTKNPITFATGLCSYNLGLIEITRRSLNIMQRNMIVQRWKIKPNDERFDLSKKDQPVKPTTPKSVSDDLGIVVEITTRSKTSLRENTNINQERWCQVCKCLISPTI